MYSGYGIAFDGAGSWTSGNDFAKNDEIFGTDNSSSSHTVNCKNNFLVFGEDTTYGINGSFDSSETKFSIDVIKTHTQFYIITVIIVVFSIMEKQSLSLKRI